MSLPSFLLPRRSSPQTKMTSFFLKVPGRRADTGPELDPPTPFYRLEHQVTGEKKPRGH